MVTESSHARLYGKAEGLNGILTEIGNEIDVRVSKNPDHPLHKTLEKLETVFQNIKKLEEIVDKTNIGACLVIAGKDTWWSPYPINFGLADRDLKTEIVQINPVKEEIKYPPSSKVVNPNYEGSPHFLVVTSAKTDIPKNDEYILRALYTTQSLFKTLGSPKPFPEELDTSQFNPELTQGLITSDEDLVVSVAGLDERYNLIMCLSAISLMKSETPGLVRLREPHEVSEPIRKLATELLSLKQ